MNRKAQVVIIGLWVVIILAILAVGIGHRVSLGLRLSQYQRDNLKALYLARAGTNRAIAEIEKDSADVDSLKDEWADNEGAFKNIAFADNENEFATVSYKVKDGEEETVKFGVGDEESKININTASQGLLVSLLEYLNITDVSKIADNIRAWRGEVVTPTPDYAELGYLNKAGKFSNLEELMLVKDVTSDIYNAMKELITIYPDPGGEKININTASSEVLRIISFLGVSILNAEGKTEITNAHAESLVSKIADYRDGDDNISGTQDDTPFQNVADIVTNLKNFKTGITSEEETVITKITDNLRVNSAHFKIETAGNAGKIERKVTAVYKRKDKILYWHES